MSKNVKVHQKKMGKIIVIVAPSGSGKSTLLTKIKNKFPELCESVSYTTRSKRPGEEHGKHYFFINQKEFLKMRNSGEFLEWALVHGDYKGTSKKFVQEQLDLGTPLIFDLDVQGADFFKQAFPKLAKVIFISPPSLTELEKRLRNRKTESEESIQLRLRNAREELGRMNDYDYNILNDDIDKAYDELVRIISDILER
ncbi:MAG: guanylate kinase [Bdellovibrio sp.]|nr:guanylate kinase [Bdellovibrio sp.]